MPMVFQTLMKEIVSEKRITTLKQPDSIILKKWDPEIKDMSSRKIESGGIEEHSLIKKIYSLRFICRGKNFSLNGLRSSSLKERSFKVIVLTYLTDTKLILT